MFGLFCRLFSNGYENSSIKAFRFHKGEIMVLRQRVSEWDDVEEGEGLGARGQGRVDPVSLSTQRGRVGLGHEASKVGITYPSL